MFEEIDRNVGADLVSYGTLIKILCLDKKHGKAFEYLQNMVEKWPTENVSSVLNNFLDSCANKIMWKMGIKVWEYALKEDVRVDEVSFGISVKLF